MKIRARWASGVVALAVAAGASWRWHDEYATRFLPPVPAEFVARFAAPPAPDSARTRRELDDLLALQSARTPAEVAAAQADRKTKIVRFYDALGFDASDPPELPHVEKLAQRVEDDVRIYVRAVKDHFRRLRPYEIEPRLQPCIENVRGDLSYPSGHSAYGWAMAYLLESMVPERGLDLEARAEAFARQRMVCGVHFPSDLAAGKFAARWVLDALSGSPQFNEELAEARSELRAALGLRLEQ
ncbi:MAG TPA: phosphatase PAP2 family protein [Steroidobacteraceae bacterium]|nr:phosphatase PAP2 family protein [Steroidobacteraceae bacterium]